MNENQKPFRLGRIAPTLPVTDIQASCRFYRDVFGLEKTFENGNPVGFMILKRDGAELHLSKVKDHPGGSHNLAHLLVDGVDALYEKCERMGVRIVKRMRDQEFGLRTFVLADPDGNRIDVGERL